MANQVDTALSLLKNGLSNLSQEEYSVLLDLYQQLGFLHLNLKASGTHNMDTIMRESLDFLANALDKHLKTKKNNSNNLHQRSADINITHHQQQRDETRTLEEQEDENQDEHLPKRGVVTTEIQKGQLIYLLDGERIKFKKLKDTTIYHQRWQANYNILREFYDHYGHVNVTRSTEGHEELGNWVTEQRRKLKKAKVSQKQFELLNELGFEWDRSHYFFRTYHQKKPEDGTPDG